MKRFVLGLLLLLNLSNSANSNEIISQIETNWNQIKTMSGHFKQEDSDGIISHGNFYFLKPYQSKFVYKDRSENIITNESLLVIVDHEDYKIEKGQSLTLRYRFIFHKGPAKDAKIEQRFSEYAKDQGHPISLMPKHPGYPEDYLSQKKK